LKEKKAAIVHSKVPKILIKMNNLWAVLIRKRESYQGAIKENTVLIKLL
jgi:hypothetical protein